MVAAKSGIKKYTYFIGIDVSKNDLDYAVMNGKDLLFHQKSKNHTDDIRQFLIQLKKLAGFTIKKAIFCMENTGFYCNHLLYCLEDAKANVVLENPIQIKKSLGLVRGKDDKADAIRIAAYARKNIDELMLWKSRRPVVLELASLFTLRNRILTAGLSLKTPINEQTGFIPPTIHAKNVRLCKRSMTALKADLAAINLNMEKLIDNDERLRKLKKLITSVPGIGPVTAIQIIVSTNEFHGISDPKKFACYAGVVPFKTESGLSTRRARISHYANKKVKSLLHICALSAIKSDPETKAYYERKTKIDGKPGLSVVNAIRNKLVIKIFACVNNDTCYVRNYLRPEQVPLETTHQIGQFL